MQSRKTSLETTPVMKIFYWILLWFEMGNLLAPVCRFQRDRSTIVDDSIALVKNLHHRIIQLQERKVVMTELACRARLAESPQQTTSTLFFYPQLKENLLPLRWLDSSSVSTEDLNKFHEFFGKCVTRLHLHSDDSVPFKFSVEMLCRPQPCLQSQIFLCLESLSLEVKQCTITTVRDFVMCVILAQVCNCC